VSPSIVRRLRLRRVICGPTNSCACHPGVEPLFFLVRATREPVCGLLSENGRNAFTAFSFHRLVPWKRPKPSERQSAATSVTLPPCTGPYTSGNRCPPQRPLSVQETVPAHPKTIAGCAPFPRTYARFSRENQAADAHLFRAQMRGFSAQIRRRMRTFSAHVCAVFPRK